MFINTTPWWHSRGRKDTENTHQLLIPDQKWCPSLPTTYQLWEQIICGPGKWGSIWKSHEHFHLQRICIRHIDILQMTYNIYIYTIVYPISIWCYWKLYIRTSLIIRRTKNCGNCLYEVDVWFSGSGKLTIRTYSWFFTNIYKAYVDISHIVSHTIFGGMILKRIANQHRYQTIRTDVIWSKWMLGEMRPAGEHNCYVWTVVNNCYVCTIISNCYVCTVVNNCYVCL